MKEQDNFNNYKIVKHMKNFNITFLFLSAAAFFSCEQPGMEYTVQPKQLTVDETTIYVDGFLKKGEPVFQGNENEPADSLAIPFNNGFGRILRVEFLDRSEETGLTIEGRTIELKYQGDKQYALFSMTGTPKKDGNIPISFNLYEGEEQIGQTITKTIPIWGENVTRPSRDLIPTSERPFIFLCGEINWVNQSAPTQGTNQKPQEFWYNGMPVPSTSVKVNGSNVSCVANLRYNSIMVANNVVRPDFTGPNNAGTLNVFAPTKENLEQYPEAFKLKNGNLSSEWGESDIFFHGTNSKPISVGMWDENTADEVISGNRIRPMSSLTWTMSSVKPYGTYIKKEGTYKIYVKYNNADEANDVIQYFPKHPVTEEAGWVSYEFTVTKNPIPGFVIDPGITTDTPNVPTYNSDWEPTEENPVKAIRGELVYNNETKIMKKGEKLGPSNGILRLWFATYKKNGETSPVGWNFRACDSGKGETDYKRGFYTPDVVSVAGAGSAFGGGTATKKTNEKEHFFDDNELNNKYFISFVDFNADNNSILNKAGTFTFIFESPANDTQVSAPKFKDGFKCPVTVTVEE